MVAYTFGISENFNGSSIALATFGGMLLGCAVVFKTACISGVLGISNYTKRLVVQPELKRVYFIGGMILASMILSYTYCGTEDLPVPNTTREERLVLFIRFIIGTFFVGWGASKQHGCTSGHGLTGLARLSPRSWVAVPTFMGVGLVSATVLQSGTSLPDQGIEEPEWWVGCTIAVSLMFFLLLAGGAVWVISRRGSPRAIAMTVLVGEFITGAAFGSGLLISGMARASKVAGFLDVLSGKWDLSLPFVMGGGCMITFPYFQAVQCFGLQKKSFLHPSNMDLPPRNKMPDRSLVLGAALFGFGWAVCGVCPGPMWVNMGSNPSQEMVAGIMSLTLGLSIQDIAAQFRLLATEKREVVASQEADPANAAAAAPTAGAESQHQPMKDPESYAFTETTASVSVTGSSPKETFTLTKPDGTVVAMGTDGSTIVGPDRHSLASSQATWAPIDSTTFDLDDLKFDKSLALELSKSLPDMQRNRV